ncbi:MAG: hypothetical protein KGH64_04310 [Candidatus Micrarchaeota archaeon]|nr:hypothetical protein [Candidatus Micrarchaeota archaeon]
MSQDKISYEDLEKLITNVPDNKDKKAYKQFVQLLKDNGWTIKEYSQTFNKKYYARPNEEFNRNKIVPKKKGEF